MYLVLVLQSISLSYRSYTGITELILILRILFLYFGSYTCLTNMGIPVGTTGLILILQNYTYFTDTGVPIGTTGLILILLIREYPWVLQNLIRYRSTRRYYKTDTEVDEYTLYSFYQHVFLIFFVVLLYK